MKKVFVDSGGWYAHLVADDAERATAHRFPLIHVDKGYSFCDALSFVVMERLRMSEAISFDRHFRQYGRFKILE